MFQGRFVYFSYPPWPDPNIGLSLRPFVWEPSGQRLLLGRKEEPQPDRQQIIVPRLASGRRKWCRTQLTEPVTEFHATSHRKQWYCLLPERAESPLDSVFCRQRKRCPSSPASSFLLPSRHRKENIQQARGKVFNEYQRMCWDCRFGLAKLIYIFIECGI